MKFGQLIAYKMNIFLRNHVENDARRLVPDLSLFFRKALYEVKASGLQFFRKGYGKFLHHILSMIFQEKYFSCYVGQCVLYLVVNHGVTS